MAVSPVNITRVSHNLRTMNLLQTLRSTSRDLFNQQTRLATGRSFIAASDNPIAASQSRRHNETIVRQEQILENLRHADLFLGSADQALSEVNDLLAQAQSIASSSIGAQADAEEREANAALIASIRERLMAVGNRQVDGQFIFAGRDTQRAPFVSALGGVAYVGDGGDLRTSVSLLDQDSYNVPGNLLFGGLATAVVRTDDLSPNLTAETRLEDLAGASLQGIRKGTILLDDGAGSMQPVDLTQADTVGDVVDMINAVAEAGGMSMTVEISGRGLAVTSGGGAIVDTSAGTTAADLGLTAGVSGGDTADASGASAGGTAIDLKPRLTPSTKLADLNGGAGVNLENGLRISNGTESVVVDLSGAETVQDVINEINGTDLFVTAQINGQGTGLEIVSRVAGVGLAISEAGGTLASDLGILTFSADAPLSSLNSGKGVHVLPGQPDLLIQSKAGDSFEVHLDDAQTLGDVVDLINAAAAEAGVSIEAQFDVERNGLLIRDNTSGTGSLSVTRADIASFAVDDLGLRKTVADPETELLGDDVSRVRSDNLFTSLIDLETALRRDDERAVSAAAEALQTIADDVIRTHGVVGARARAMQDRVDQTENAVASTRALLSNVQDLDFTEAITVFQQAQTALQANLLSGSQLLNISLLDFLR